MFSTRPYRNYAMTLFIPSLPRLPTRDGDPVDRDGDRVFSLEIDPRDDAAVQLVVRAPGSCSMPHAIWNRRLPTAEVREPFLDRLRDRQPDLIFLGRLTMISGSQNMDAVFDQMVDADRAEREAEAERSAEEARERLNVNLYAREGKYGRRVLELQRGSSSKADWSVTYDRAVERDRLCDWLRWQSERFLGFLDYAAEHGDEALARVLTDEMFETERRVKKDGRGAGGTRPLRMWRGD